MNKFNKCLVFLVIACLSIVIIPRSVLTSSAEIYAQAVTPVFSVNTPQATVVVFGGKEWVVIGHNGDGVASTSGALTLLAKSSFGYSQFNPAGTNNTYQGSELQRSMDYAANCVTGLEAKLIIPRKLIGGSGNYINIPPDVVTRVYVQCPWNSPCITITETVTRSPGGSTYDSNLVAGPTVSGAKFWPLSVAEARKLNESLRLYSNNWWLRSPGMVDGFAAMVSSSGSINDTGYFIQGLSSNIGNIGVAYRPAFDLDISSVVFASPVWGGKSTIVSSENLSPMVLSSWALKFTAESIYHPITNPHGLALARIQPIAVDGRTITFEYSGATAGKTLSAIVTSGGTVRYYGKLADNILSTGTASVTVPDDFAATDALYIFVEECNGIYYTDFASARHRIAVAEQAVPVGLQGVACSSSGNTGKITGLNAARAYEYKLLSETKWKQISGVGEITSLPAGDYEVRTAASGMMLASLSVVVIVEEYVPPTYAVGFIASVAAANGITAIGRLSPNGPVAEGEILTATITISGTALAPGRYSVGLTSATLGDAIIPPGVDTKKISASGTIVSDESFDFTFAMPARAVEDLVVNIGFMPPDTSPPVPGGGGVATASNITPISLSLDWVEAADDESPSQELVYYVYQQTGNTFSVVDGVPTDGSLLNSGGAIGITTYYVTGLLPSTNYYFVVVVEDEAGNKAAYIAINANTASEPTTVPPTRSITTLTTTTTTSVEPAHSNPVGTIEPSAATDTNLPLHEEVPNPWSLASLVCGVFGVLLAVITVILAFVRKNIRLFWLYMGIILAIAGVVLFVLTESLNGRMMLVDTRATGYAVILAVELLFFALSFRRRVNG